MVRKCISCSKPVSRDSVEFRCPKCGKSNIIRCRHCRIVSQGYTCTECGFQGP
jgi:predicted RNA-binding Zn-ribbon protein involved in translation (DUF1610 family)